MILFGAATSLLTTLTGFADWLDTDKGTQIRRMANAHAITMIALTLVVLAGLWYRYLAPGGHSDMPSGILALVDLAMLGLVTLGGTLGGSLTYDWGFNVETAGDSPVYHPSQTDIIHPN